jgi:o-succinylbenzoate---CoA ligase
VGFWQPTSDPERTIAEATNWLASKRPAHLVIQTSGSTGIPKQVVLRREALLASVKATAERLGGEGQWLLTLPPHHIAGLQVIVRSLVAGYQPIVVDRNRALASQLPDHPIYTSLVSTQLVRWVTEAKNLWAWDKHPEQLWARFATILVGGGPVDVEARAKAEAAGATIVATYGMSETAGGCVYEGRPLPEVQVRLTSRGRIAICGPMLAAGYQDNPQLSAEHFQHGWFLTDDLGELGPSGTLRVSGRVDEVIISGGVKVGVVAVANQLRTLSNIGEVQVFGVPDQDWGERVVAFVTGQIDLTTARDVVAQTLPRSWAPRQLVHVTAWPLTTSGKVDRQTLQLQAQAEQ